MSDFLNIPSIKTLNIEESEHVYYVLSGDGLSAYLLPTLWLRG